MDHVKKKLLTQSTPFIMSHLTPNNEMIEALRKEAVLTHEESNQIIQDDTTAGKCILLICFIRKKDNRSWTKFITILEQYGASTVSSMLRSKSTASEVVLPDKRTLSYLETCLNNISVPHKIVKEVATKVVLKEVYHDDVSTLQEKILNLQRSLRAASLVNPSPAHPTLPPISRPDSEERSMSVSSEESFGELHALIKQKEDAIKKKDKEYERLKNIMNDIQQEYDTLMNVNQEYLNIITNLQAIHDGKTPRSVAAERDAAILDMKSALFEAQEKIESLRTEVQELDVKAKDAQSAFNHLQKKELKYREMLGLPPDSDNESVERRIQELLQNGTMQKSDLDKLKQELNKVKESRLAAEEKLNAIVREKEHIEFYMRQQEMTMRRMKRQTVAKPTLVAAESTVVQAKIAGALRLPSIEPSCRPTTGKHQQKLNYCIFCRTEFDNSKATTCRVHYRALVKGHWMCCKDECHRGAGCLQLPHMYIEITADRKVFLTDGARYAQLL
ncbi:DgyrCDS617 [Dimorphilus gyrociliatus]|nr:DgyrCDS617 [Dimorphilus gyrociliatus]